MYIFIYFIYTHIISIFKQSRYYGCKCNSVFILVIIIKLFYNIHLKKIYFLKKNYISHKFIIIKYKFIIKVYIYITVYSCFKMSCRIFTTITIV